MSESTRRRVLQLLGASVIVGTAGCSSFMGSGVSKSGSTAPEQTTTIEQTTASGNNETMTTTAKALQFKAPNGIVPGASLPSNPGSYRYATMGSGDTPVTATLYGAWFCPYTHEVVMNFLDSLVEQYIEPGKLTLTFRAIPYDDGKGFHGFDEPKVARAALAVWNKAPQNYWSFFKYMYKNVDATATWSADEVVKLAKAAGVEATAPIRSAYNGNASYESAIVATMKQKKEIPIPAVPRIVVSETISKPSVSRQETINQIEAALQGSTGTKTGGNESTDNSSN